VIDRRALLGAVLATPALAQPGYPTRPLRIIVPWPPGGANDVMARIAGEHLQRAWGQPVVIENRPGGGGSLGTDLVAKAAPDGYTLLLGSVGPLTVNPSLYVSLPYEPLRDFAPVVMLGKAPNVLVVPPSLPVNSVAELVALAKARPGALNFGSPGIGTSPHLAAELFKQHFGVEIVHVPYRGNTATLEALIKGEIQVIFDSMAQAVVQVRAGMEKALAVTAPTRWPDLPEVPSMAEAGAPQVDVQSWFGLVAPARTPAEIVARLNGELQRGLATPEAAEKLRTVGTVAAGGSAADMAAFMRLETERWGRVVRTAGIRIE
jgi:tripartite-type tricarboxylate transporter receptor subunit TctC